jgi:hypothetical protein
MKTGPENKVKKQVKDLLNRHGIFNFPVAASPYGYAGISDRLAVLPNGKLLAIECKAPGKLPTPLQMEFLKKVNANKGYGFVVDGESALNALDYFLTRKVYY